MQLRPFLIAALALSACASTPRQGPRTPASAGYLSALEENYLYCEHESSIQRIPNAFVVKHIDGVYRYVFTRQQQHPYEFAELSCKEQDQGITCFGPKNKILRVDYAFEDKHLPKYDNGVPMEHRLVAAFDRVSWGTDDDYHCTIELSPTLHGVFDSLPF